MVTARWQTVKQAAGRQGHASKHSPQTGRWARREGLARKAEVGQEAAFG